MVTQPAIRSNKEVTDEERSEMMSVNSVEE